MRRPSPSMVIACVALFFALTGAGMATTGYRITSLWQIAPKVRHALRGHTGATGPQGIQGPPGIAGSPGTFAPIDWRNDFRWSEENILTSQSPEASASVLCRDGQQAITGGFHGDDGVIVTASEPLLAPLPADAVGSTPQPAIGWTVTAHLAPDRNGQTFEAWVVCR